MADFAAAVRGAAAVSGRSKTIRGTGGTTPTFLRSGVDVRGRPDARGRVDGRDCRRGARRGVAPPGGARGWSGASDQLRNFVRRPRIRQRLRDARLWHQGGPRRGRADVPGQTPDDLLSGSIDETVVVFFSDNGAMASSTTPTGARANYFTGGKTLTTEGGVRVPCFIRYPPLLAPSGWHGGLFHVVDLFPTLAALAKGADHTNFEDLDGVDAVPQLLDARAPGRRREVLVNINPRADDRDQLKAPKAAIRRDDFKLSFEFWSNRSGVALYDLARDPMETADVADRHPLVVRALADRLEAHAANLVPPFEPWPPFQGADYACCDCEETFARGAPAVWTPWIPDDYEAAAPCAPPFAPCLVPPCYGH